MRLVSWLLAVAGWLRLRGRSGFPASVARRVLDRLGGPSQQVWSIGIRTGESPLALGPPTDDHNPVMTAADATDVRASFVADPFILRVDSGWHMFFEIMNADTGRGEIASASSDDGLTWEYAGIVLTEPFHLAYPFVFEHEGESYMVPETIDADAIRLYRASNYPRRWRHIATLVEGRFADPCPFPHDGRWWMFAGDGSDDRDGTLRLFHAEKLFGPWREHPASPIVRDDPLTVRPAGRPVVIDGRVIRFAQVCRPQYGTSVAAFRIEELTSSEYVEYPVGKGQVLEGGGKGWNKEGMHHIDAHRLADGTWLAAVDRWRW